MKRKLRVVLLIFFIVMFAGCAAYLGAYYINRGRAEGELDSLALQVEQARATPRVTPTPVAADVSPDVSPDASPDVSPGVSPEPSEPEMLEVYRGLYSVNSDLVGWLTVPGMNINFPVMQTPDNQNFYLRRGWDREYSVYGLPFTDAACNVETSDNVIIYAHKKSDGSMFGRLDSYADESFWETHRYLYFDTLYEERTYEVIAAFRGRILYQNEEGFRYYAFHDAADEADFNDYIDNVMALALYDTGLTASYGDKLVTLSTCAYHTKNGRFVVVARLVED